MRVLFTSAPLNSHLGWGGYLSTAAELNLRGHAVLWVSGTPVAEAVNRHSIPFCAVEETGWRTTLPDPLPQGASEESRRLRALDQWLEPNRVLAGYAELLPVAQAFEPDLIVGEMFMAASALVAEQIGCPFGVAGWPAPVDRLPAAPQPLLDEAHNRLVTLLQQTGVAGRNWTRQAPPALCSPHLHLSYWSREWFTGWDGPDASPPNPPYGPQTRHVGGVAPAAGPPLSTLPAPQDRPWVLITLGTTFNQDPAFFQMATHAVENLGALPVVAFGALLDTPWVAATAEKLAPSALCYAWLDFEAVLPYTAAALHHGGAGTTHAFITHAIPQIVVPHAADQMRQAQGVARTGIGYGLLPKQTTVDALTTLLAQILPDRSPARAAAQRLQTAFAALGGISTGADALESVAGAIQDPDPHR